MIYTFELISKELKISDLEDQLNLRDNKIKENATSHGSFWENKFFLFILLNTFSAAENSRFTLFSPTLFWDKKKQ